ncbi:MAG: adhesin domain containing protein [Peptoniphilus harei]|nr:adhesin domain containing protein [Peptoniphilus harei]
MKNPIKNGKEVFAVLSMATVMSISMSVKVDAASNAANNEDTKNIVIEAAQNMDRSSSSNDGVDNSGSKEATAKREDNKEALAEDTKATDSGSNEVTGENSATKADTPALEVSEENKAEAVRSVKAQYSQSETDKLQVSEEKTPQAQQAGETEAPKAFELKKPIPVGVYDSKNLTEEEIANVKKAVVEANSALKNTTINVTKEGKVTFTDPDGKEQTIDAADTVVKDYGIDEAKIKNYDGSERYRTTDLQPGDTNQEFYKTDEKEEKDGFKFEFKNPSKTSPSKTEYGYQITIDKKTGQRTYTKIYVTDSGLVPVDPGNKPMMGEGEKLTPESPGVNYKPGEDSSITASRRQRNLNYEASEETLKHINNKDNNSTSFGMEDNYTQDNPGVKFFAGNFALGYKVNPWPNENDKLELLKLNTEKLDPDAKYFVKGQDIDTGVKVDNIDDSAKERLVGQVYHPVTGKIVPGAKAYIGNDGNIHITMPKGAINEDGSINKDSIFSKDPSFRGIQSLDVKFFARPRTADEFKKIAETPNESGDTGTYTGSGAGTTDINHKGANVTIDKQGIDRYDHYNLIGNFKLNLDDTRYYNQRFEDGNNDDTSTITSSAVKPGDPFKVKIVQPENPKDIDKSAEEMNAAKGRGEAFGKIDLAFVNKENEGKKDEDKWKVDLDPNDISKFTITPPKSAKAGDFVAIPVEYTYTNGSTDVHWFHFVVQESDNNRPEYHAEVGYKGDTLTQTPELPNDEAATKKNQPKSYELVMPEDGSNYKDSAGNEWTNIKVDPKTGAVTAVVPEDADIKGGENLYVNVKVNYKDEKTGEEKEEIVKAQFIARPKYKQEVSKTFNSKIPFETKVIYDDTLEIGKVVKSEGRIGETETTFKQVVINGEKGIIDENGNFVKDKEAVETKTTIEKVDAEIRIGTKPAETTVTIPPDTEYETSDSLEKGTMQLKEKGEEGTVTITTKRDPETGEITTTKVTTKEAKNKKMLIGTKTESTIVHEEEIPFEYEIKFDPTLKPGEKVVDKEGKPGSKTTTYKIENSQVVGEPEVYKTDPVKAIIRVGDQKFTGETSHKVTEETKYLTIVEEDPTLPVGETKEVQKGVRGSKTTEYTQKFENGVPGEVKEELVSEKPAVNRIIKVGTKTVKEHISKEITEEIPYGVKIEYDDTMPAGKTKVKTPGEPGSKTTEYYRTLINGKFDGDLNTREVTDKYKAPVDEVIVVGTKVETNSEEYKNDVKVEIEKVENPDLYKGIVNEGELTPGKVERKIINKYDPETGKITTEEKVVVTPAKQKIIVGTKDFTGEFKHTIENILPFEREIQYDDTMDAGTKEVIKGVNGHTEQTITQKYTNGVLADKEYSDVKTTKEPVKEIVKIGTKPVEKVVEIPFNTVYVLDKTIDAGTVVEDKDHMGKAGRVTVKTYFDKELGKFVSVEDETSKVGPVNKIVRVGTKPNENMCPVPENPSVPDDSKPENPSNPTDPSNSSNPGGDKPGTPGDNTQSNPGENSPNKPGENTPSEPGKETPKKPGENPSVDPKNTQQESPDKSKLEKENDPKLSETEKVKEAEKAKEADEEIETEEAKVLNQVKKEEDEEASRVGNEVGKAKIAGDDKAPKTGDAGLMAETASAGLASGLLLLLGRFKRKKEDEE